MIPLPGTPLVADVDALEAVSGLAAPIARAAEHLRYVTKAAATDKARAVSELRRALLQVGCSVPDDDRIRGQLARVLYWGYPAIPVRDIVLALAFPDQRALVAAAGAIDSGIPCEGCATRLEAESRSRLTEIHKAVTGRRRPWSVAVLCEVCREAKAQAEADVWVDDPWPEPDPDWPWDDHLDPAA